MVDPRESQIKPTWTDASPEPDWDDELTAGDDFIQFDSPDEELEFDDARTRARSLSSWQRIEIAREKRMLRSILDDYDDFEYPLDDYLAEYSS